MNKHLRLPLVLTTALVLAACGGGGDSEQESAPTLADNACAQLGVAKVIEDQVGGKAAILTETVSADDGVTKAHCVWRSEAPDVSDGGATVEVVIYTGNDGDLDDSWETATSLDAAPAEWRPAGTNRTTEATPTGDWSEAQGNDYSHKVAGTQLTRLFSYRAVRREGLVTQVAVRMDSVGQVSPGPAAIADEAVSAAPALLS